MTNLRESMINKLTDSITEELFQFERDNVDEWAKIASDAIADAIRKHLDAGDWGDSSSNRMKNLAIERGMFDWDGDNTDPIFQQWMDASGYMHMACVSGSSCDWEDLILIDGFQRYRYEVHKEEPTLKCPECGAGHGMRRYIQ